jgi:hypothetical protein
LLVSELDTRWSLVAVSCCCEKLVAEAGDSWDRERRGRGTSAVGSRYQKTAEDTAD